MKITFGSDGRVIQVANVNTDKLGNLNAAKNIIKQNIPKNFTRVESEIYTHLKELRDRR